MKPTPAQLQEAIEFIANSISTYTNTLDVVVRKPYADCAGRHMQTIMLATQEEPPEKEEEAE